MLINPNKKCQKLQLINEFKYCLQIININNLNNFKNKYIILNNNIFIKLLCF